VVAAGFSDGVLRLLGRVADPPSLQLIEAVKPHTKPIEFIAFSSDVTLLATAGMIYL
jgi:hypothetical protein